MSQLDLTLPAMYADHHVTAVRRILLQLPGVEDVVASSSLRRVLVTFDSATTNVDTIHAALEDAGYTGDPAIPIEADVFQPNDTMKPFARHTAVYAHTQPVISFAQTITTAGRALWPCPGIGVLKTPRVEDDVGDG